MGRVPWITAGIATLTLLGWASPTVAEWLVYDRGRVRQGELWRLATAALVHLSPRHLWYNLVALGVGGWLLERRGAGGVLVLALLASLSGGFAVHVASPELARFAGLSGVVYAFLGALALDGIATGGRWRWACACIFLALVGKIALEWAGEGLLLVDDAPGVVSAPVSHLAGLASALLAAALRAFTRSRAPTGGHVRARRARWVGPPGPPGPAPISRACGPTT